MESNKSVIGKDTEASVFDYSVMKQKLVDSALSVALWEMEVEEDDPVSPKNRITWSQDLRSMLGFSDEADFPNTIEALADRFHPEDSEKAFAAFAAHFSDRTGKTPYNIEYRLKNKNGEYRWYQGVGSTLRDGAGVPLKVAGAVMDIDERKILQSQLLIMSSIVHNSPHFISYKEINGDCLYVNPATTHITGFSEEDLKSDYLGTLFDEDTAKQISNQVISDLRESGVAHYEGRSKTKDNPVPNRIFSGTSFLIEKDAFASIAQDVTDIKKTELERVEALNTMKSVLDELDAIIYVTDPKTGEILFMNESMRKHYDIDGEVEGHICYKVLQVGMDERCEFCPCYQLDKDPYGVVVWEHTDPFTHRVHRKTDRYLKWIDGRNVHLQHAVDITDYVKAEENLKRHEKMLAALNNTAIVFLSQRDGTFEDMMTTGLRLFCDEMSIDRVSVWRNDSKPETLHVSQIYRWDLASGGTTKPTPELAHTTYTQFAPRWETCLANGDSINSPARLLPEATMLKSFGVVSVFVTPVFFNNEFWGFVMFEDRDTERFFDDNSAEVMRSAAFLCTNTVVLNETSEHNRQMTEELKIALLETQEANRAKSDFLSRMSHEMLTPMNAITGMNQIMKKRGLPENLVEYNGKIENASRNLLKLINDLLDIAGRNDGTFKLVESTFSFDEMFRNVKKEINLAIVEKQQTLSSYIDHSVSARFIGDEKRLSQVILNLLANAVKFTPQHGELVFSARMIDETDGIDTVQIEVRDNGIGISKEKQREIFEIFEQVDGGISRKEGGSGLGLTLSEYIIKLMGGRIWVESELGHGSTFTFTCKLKKVDFV